MSKRMFARLMFYGIGLLIAYVGAETLLWLFNKEIPEFVSGDYKAAKLMFAITASIAGGLLLLFMILGLADKILNSGHKMSFAEPLLFLDLRNRTVEEVIDLVKTNGLGTGETADFTDNYPGILEEGRYASVICVWLITSRGDTGDKTADQKEKPKVSFILWDGAVVPQRPDHDLHGFVKKDGTINWGQANSMNLMR